MIISTLILRKVKNQSVHGAKKKNDRTGTADEPTAKFEVGARIAQYGQRIRIRICIVPVQAYKEICLTVHSRKQNKKSTNINFNTATNAKKYTKHTKQIIFTALKRKYLHKHL